MPAEQAVACAALGDSHRLIENDRLSAAGTHVPRSARLFAIDAFNFKTFLGITDPTHTMDAVL